MVAWLKGAGKCMMDHPRWREFVWYLITFLGGGVPCSLTQEELQYTSTGNKGLCVQASRRLGASVLSQLCATKYQRLRG